MQSQLLPTSWVSCSWHPGLPFTPHLFWVKGTPVHVDFSSSQALPPFTLYLQTLQTVLEPISVCKHLRNFGTSFNILHIDTGWFPTAPLGRGERVLLWPMKQFHFTLLFYIRFLSLVISDTGIWDSRKLRTVAKSQMLRKILKF